MTLGLSLELIRYILELDDEQGEESLVREYDYNFSQIIVKL